MSKRDHPKYLPGSKAFGALLEMRDAAQQGRPPSAAAVKIIADAFEAWVEQEGERTYDEIFGFRVNQRGRAGRPFMEHYRARVREWYLAHLVAVLMARGLTEWEAARGISAAINKSHDLLWRKQLRELRAQPPREQRKRAVKEGGKKTVQEIAHLPPESLVENFRKLGGEPWARLLGYFGECEESRKVAQLDESDQDTANWLFFARRVQAFPFRDADQLLGVIPPEALPDRFRA